MTEESNTPTAGATSASEAPAHEPTASDGGAVDVESPPAGTLPPLERARQERPALVPRWVIVAAVAVVAVIAVAIGVLIYSRAIASVTVPKVVGVEEGVARASLSEVDLEMTIGERRFSSLPLGRILSQEPSPGVTAHRGDTVRVAVSAGSEQFAMPDVVGDGLLLARGELESKGLIIKVETQPSQTASNTVLSSNPSPGTLVRTGDVVRLTVSAADGGANLLLPYDLTGVSVVIDPAPSAKSPVDETLEVSRRLQALIEASGGTVVPTRTVVDTGATASPTERAKRARSRPASVAVGLSVADSGPGGVVLSSPAGNSGAARLSSQVASALAGEKVTVTVAPSADDAVLGGTLLPWVRLQLGSSASKEDVSNFRDPSWADSIARALYRSVAGIYGKKSATQ